MDFSFHGLIHRHNSEMEAAFRGLVNTIINHSKLDIVLLRIGNVTEDSFHATLEARVTRTGPATANMAPMTISLCGASGLFAEIALPAITTQANGSDIVVTNQMVKILDTGALKNFIQAVIGGPSAMLSLRNGNTTIKALGVGPRPVVFEKNIDFPGMDGPVVTVKAASLVQNAGNIASSISALQAETAAAAAAAAAAAGRKDSSASTSPVMPSPSPTTGNFCSLLPINNTFVNVTLAVSNPGPLEISFGTCHFDIQNEKGDLVAELKGRLDIRRNRFEVTIQGIVNRNVTSKLARDLMRHKKGKQPAGPAGAGSSSAAQYSYDYVHPEAGSSQYHQYGGNQSQQLQVHNATSSSSPVEAPAAPVEPAVPEARLVGKRCAGAGWCDDAVKNINVPVHNMGVLFRALGMEHDPEEIQRLTPPDAQEPFDGIKDAGEEGDDRHGSGTRKNRGFGFSNWTRRFGL